MKVFRERAPFFLLALAGVLLDEAVQRWLRGVLQPSEARMPELMCHPLLRFNPDFAWGLLSFPLDRATAVFIGLYGSMAVGFAVLLLRARGVTAVCVALLLGWTLNACLDRLRYGAVVDFIVCQSSDGQAVTFNVGDSLAFFALLLLAGKAWAVVIRRHRINAANPPRDHSGTV